MHDVISLQEATSYDKDHILQLKVGQQFKFLCKLIGCEAHEGAG